MVYFQPRYFLIAMAYNCTLNGTFTILFSIYPGLMSCWPFGEVVCQAQVIIYLLGFMAVVLLSTPCIKVYPEKQTKSSPLTQNFALRMTIHNRKVCQG